MTVTSLTLALVVTVALIVTLAVVTSGRSRRRSPGARPPGAPLTTWTAPDHRPPAPHGLADQHGRPPGAPSPDRSFGPTAGPSRVFVSYRRTDTRYAARGVADHLRHRFGRAEVFMDVDSLAAGVDFVDGVVQAIQASAVVVVLIGEHWLTTPDDRGRPRLHDPSDHVRTEIEQAFRMRKPVLPVLLDGAAMPRTEQLPSSLGHLPRVNAVRLDHDSWDADIARLVQAVERLRSAAR